MSALKSGARLGEPDAVHRLLVGSALRPGSAGVPRRRVSLCHDGTPIVYSHELRPPVEPSPFRVLVEPGDLRMTVPAQVDFSLCTLDAAIQMLGWQNATANLNGIIRVVFPPRATLLEDWWGGVWLGCAILPGRAEVRVYMNLRSGDAPARWDRVGRALSCCGDGSLRAPLQLLASAVHPHAIPVGLGVVLCGGQVRAIRLYAAMRDPCLESILAARPEDVEIDRAEVGRFCGLFRELGGPFRPQAVTLGFDFLVGNQGLVEPRVARMKVDVSCQFFTGEQQAVLLREIAALAGRWGLSSEAFTEFLTDLDACFHGFAVEYVSASVRPGRPALTVYAKPNGYASN